jgi:nucleoid DNA-binding protein
MPRNTLTKQEIISNIYEKVDLPEAAVRAVIQKVFDNIVNALKEGKSVEIRRFGVFEYQIRKPRVGRNPKNPSVDITVPERAAVKFRAGTVLQKALLKSFSKSNDRDDDEEDEDDSANK